MATTLATSITGNGTLTGSGTQNTVHTADSDSVEETVTIFLLNTGSSTRTFQVWLNGTANVNRLVPAAISLLTHEYAVLKITMAASDFLKIEGSAATDFVWTKAVRRLKVAA